MATNMYKFVGLNQILRYPFFDADSRNCIKITRRAKIATRDFEKSKKGGAGQNWYPVKRFNHFVIFWNVKTDDETKQFVVDEQTMQKLGNTPKILTIYFAANPRLFEDEHGRIECDEGGRPIWNLSDIYRANLQCWRKFLLKNDNDFAKKNNGVLRMTCQGNGVIARRLNEDGVWNEIPCEPISCEFAQSKDAPCKAHGNLYFYMTEFSTGGLCSFHTTSPIAINSFRQTLLLMSDYLHGQLIGVPFKLHLYEETAVDRLGQKQETQRVYLEEPNISDLQKYRRKGIEYMANKHHLIGSPDVKDVEYEATEAVIEEFAEKDEVNKFDNILEKFRQENEIILKNEEGDNIYSPDDDENVVAAELIAICLYLSKKSNGAKKMTEVLKELTKDPDNPKSTGTEMINDFFVSKYLNNAQHEKLMQRLRESHKRGLECLCNERSES